METFTKLIESYSLNTGLKIGNSYLYEQFMPMPYSRFIIISTGGGNNNFPAKLYEYWQLVIDLIKPELDKQGINIIQVGLTGEERINGALDLLGKTSIHQLNYLISKCLLYCSNDSIGTHLAGWHDKKIVALFGSTSIANHGPYYGNKENQILIESPKNGAKTTFANVENPKTINRIKPELVANSILKLLNIDYKCNIETIHLGEHYNNSTIEIIPNQTVRPNFFSGTCNIRGEIVFDEQKIYGQIQLCRSAVVIGQPLNIDILKQLKPNIALICIKIDKFPNIIEYIKKIQRLGIQFSLITDITDEDELNQRKLLLYEYGCIIPQKKLSKKDIEFQDKIDYNNVRIKSKSLVLSDNKCYISIGHYLQDRPCQSVIETESEWIDNTEFYSNMDRYWVYNKI